jgi:sulfite reductase beta subunit-like hemoprotein
VSTLERRLKDHNQPLSVHWSGCPAGCGNHQVADIGLQGKRTRVNGEVIDTVDVFVGGASGRNAVPGIRVMEDVPCTELPQVAEFLVKYGQYKHLREQLVALGATTAEAPAAQLAETA